MTDKQAWERVVALYLSGRVVPTHPIYSLGCKVCQEQHDDQTVYTTAVLL